MTEKEFIKFLEASNIPCTEKMLEDLKKYVVLLQEYNKKFNLTSIEGTKEIYLKHFCDSLLPCNYFNISDYRELVDIGTGAGFPGLVLKIFNPDLHLYLIESNSKKCEFLKVITKELNLSNVEIINERAEDFAIKNVDRFELVISRAVADLRILTELSLPLVKEKGLFIAMKGKVGEELQNSEKTINLLNGKAIDVIKYKLPILDHDRSLIIIEKRAKTPKGYPRKYNEILKSN